MKIIDRYLLREILKIFFLALFAVSFILVVGRILQLMDLIVNKGVGLKESGKLVIFLLPYFLVFTIPVSLLVSLLVGIGRLSTDNELVVLRAAGISLYRIFCPFFLLSLFFFFLTLGINLFLVPMSNQATKKLLYTVVHQGMVVGLKERVFNDTFKDLLLYANHLSPQGNYMEGVMIFDNRLSPEASTVFARRAYLISLPESSSLLLRLEEGSIHTINLRRKNYRKIDFHSYDFNLNIHVTMTLRQTKENKNSTEMNLREFMEFLARPQLDEGIRRELTVELNKKFVLPLACIIFGMMGMSLSIQSTRAARSRGVLLAVGIAVFYYLLQLGGAAVAETGRIPVGIGLWLPPFVFFFGGCYLLIRTGHEGY